MSTLLHYWGVRGYLLGFSSSSAVWASTKPVGERKKSRDHVLVPLVLCRKRRRNFVGEVGGFGIAVGRVSGSLVVEARATLGREGHGRALEHRQLAQFPRRESRLEQATRSDDGYVANGGSV
jgi:hypothetical protein